MNLVGIDQSYTCTGVCHRDSVGVISFKRFMSDPTDKWFDRARHLSTEIADYVSRCNPDSIVMESPVVGGNYSEGLFALYSLLADKLLPLADFTSVPAQYLKSFYGRRSPTKTEMKDFAIFLINEYKIPYRFGDSVGKGGISSRQFNADEAEGFLLMLFSNKVDFLGPSPSGSVFINDALARLSSLKEKIYEYSNKNLYWFLRTS